MRYETQRLLIVSCLAVVSMFFCKAAWGLIEVYKGNDPVPNMGWPNGAEQVANLPERLGYSVGPPFGGGEYYFSYSCRDAEQFNEALRRFGRSGAADRQNIVVFDGRVRSPHCRRETAFARGP